MNPAKTPYLRAIWLRCANVMFSISLFDVAEELTIVDDAYYPARQSLPGHRTVAAHGKAATLWKFGALGS